MTRADAQRETVPRARRIDARRNEQALLDAASDVFISSGVDAPVREVAARAGVGMGTIYRHFPTRADLVIAVYRHQVEALAEAGPTLLAESPSARVALQCWATLFVDFLVTKHGLAGALQNQRAEFDSLHSYFVERLVPVCAELLEVATRHHRSSPSTDAYSLMRGIGNLCIGASSDSRYDAKPLVEALIAGVLTESD